MMFKPVLRYVFVLLCCSATVCLAEPSSNAESSTGQASPDKQYQSLMSELSAIPEGKRRGISLQRLEYAMKEVRLRKDGYHAMMLGWFYYERRDLATAERLFTQAGDWGQKEQSRHGRSLVLQQKAYQAVKDNDTASALRLTTQAAELGNTDSYLSTGWKLFDKQAYGDAFTAFSRAPSSSVREQALAETCFQQSRQLLESGEDELAEKAARCSQEHGRGGAMTALGWALYEDGQYARADRFFGAQRPPSESSIYGDALSKKAVGNAVEARELACRNDLHSQRIKQLCVDLIKISQNQGSAESDTPLPQPVELSDPSESTGGTAANTMDESRLSQAIEYYHAGAYEKSYELFLALRPGIIEKRDPGLLTLSGWAAYHAGKVEKARDDFLIAAEWDDDPKVWLMVAEAEIALKNPDRGREIVEGLPPSAERDKMLARLISLQATAAYEEKDYARAESLLTHPELAFNDDNLEMLGWSRYQQGKYEAAIPAFEAAYRFKPTISRAKGLVFSHMHLRQPARLVALGEELQGPLYELTSDEEVGKKLNEGDEDWVGVSPEGELLVQEPPDYTPPLTRALKKLEGIPGFTWGNVEHSFVDNDTHLSFILNQGINWLVLPGDITFNTFLEYRSVHNDLKSFYDEDEIVYGLEFQHAPFNLGVEHSPAKWRGKDQEQDITTAYLSWYHSWYKYLRRRRSNVSNPLNANAYAGSTYGRISNQLNDGGVTTARGFVRQGVDWFTTITDAGEITLNTYAAYRFRFRDEDKYWYNAHGPAVGIELQRSPFSLGLDYMWQFNPERDTSENLYSLYLTWYYDWNLRPE